jgi:hypothetical protein
MRYVVEDQPANAGPLIRTVALFQIEGQHYRVEYPLEGSSQRGPNSISAIEAYNGDQYQYLDRNNSVLLLRRSRPETGYGSNLPLLEPYSGLFSSVTDRTFDVLRDNKTRWEKVLDSSKIIGSGTFAGRECIIVEHNRGGDFASRTYFANESEHFPVGFELFDSKGQRSMSYTVEELWTYGAGPEAVYIPTLAHEAWYRPEDGRMTRSINLRVLTEAIRINGDIPDAVFTISPAQAAGVEDMDNPANTHHPGLQPGRS